MLSVWVGDDRLAALALICAKGDCVSLEFVEGDPRLDCPLKGLRLIAVLDVATRYGQLLGKPCLRVMPANPALIALYERGYGFRPVQRFNEAPYWVREI
jgi:hypothetical protein